MSADIKLNLGCGGNRLDGWQNHDADVDISKPLPWGDNSVSFILAEHVVEHVTHIEALAFMEEARRILRPGGILRLCIPVLERLSPEHAKDIIINHGHKAAYSTILIENMLRAAGFLSACVKRTQLRDCDGHWRVIGHEKDSQETARIEAMKE